MTSSLKDTFKLREDVATQEITSFNPHKSTRATDLFFIDTVKQKIYLMSHLLAEKWEASDFQQTNEAREKNHQGMLGLDDLLGDNLTIVQDYIQSNELLVAERRSPMPTIVARQKEGETYTHTHGFTCFHLEFLAQGNGFLVQANNMWKDLANQARSHTGISDLVDKENFNLLDGIGFWKEEPNPIEDKKRQGPHDKYTIMNKQGEAIVCGDEVHTWMCQKALRENNMPKFMELVKGNPKKLLMGLMTKAATARLEGGKEVGVVMSKEDLLKLLRRLGQAE